MASDNRIKNTHLYFFFDFLTAGFSLGREKAL